jgi:hypothetical protein
MATRRYGYLPRRRSRLFAALPLSEPDEAGSATPGFLSVSVGWPGPNSASYTTPKDARLWADGPRLVEQLKELAEAALAINSPAPLDRVIQEVTERARALIGAHQAITSMTTGQNWAQAITAISLSEKYAAYRE